jgi:hypothetical protein
MYGAILTFQRALAAREVSFSTGDSSPCRSEKAAALRLEKTRIVWVSHDSKLEFPNAGAGCHQRCAAVAATEPTSDERRTRDRFPIPYTFRLTPIDHAGNLLMDETSTVVGRDLSLSGIGFSHDTELKYQRAVISLNHPKVGKFAVEAEIVWTRPTLIGLFESGCRLLRTLDGHAMRLKM